MNGRVNSPACAQAHEALNKQTEQTKAENAESHPQIVCVIYLSDGIVPTLWDAIFDIKTKQLRNSLGFNISVFIVYVSNG